MLKVWDLLGTILLLNQIIIITGSDGFTKTESTTDVPKLTRYAGCYSGCGRFDSYMQHFKQVNQDCREFCANKAYTFAATHGTFCGCMNSLESMLPVTGRIGEEGVANNKSKCTTSCPGSSSYKKGKPCKGEDCCGGPSAYSVFATGKIDVATVLVTRIYDVLKLMKKLFGDQKPQMKKEDLRVKVVVKMQSNKKYRICEKSGNGVICDETKKAPKLKPVSFVQENYEREAQHITPSMIKPLKGYQSTMDLTTMDGKLKKSYVVKDRTNTSNNVEAGFDAVVSESLSKNKDHQMYKWIQKFKEGFSFTGVFKQNVDTMTETETTNTVKVTADVPKFGKGEIEFFQDYYDITVKWIASVLASGKAELTWINEKKEINLQDFLSKDQRRFHTAGTLRFGDRRTISAVIKIQPADTGILQESTIKDESKNIQIQPKVEVTATTDYIDEDTVKDDAAKPCPKKEFKVVDKCRHRFDVDILHDKQVECESKFDGEEVCALFCAKAGSLMRRKTDYFTEVICPSKSDENTTRDSDALDSLRERSRIFCEDTFRGLTKFKIKSASGGYLFGGDKLVLVFEGEGGRNWKLTEWNLYPAEKDGYYFIKSFATGKYLIRTDSDTDDKMVKMAESTKKEHMAWKIKRRGENLELISWKGDSLHSAPDTFKVTAQESFGSGMEWKIVEEF